MFKNGQKVSADEIYAAGWEIDSHSEVTHSTTYVSPDGTQTATIYKEHDYEAKIENI